MKRYEFRCGGEYKCFYLEDDAEAAIQEARKEGNDQAIERWHEAISEASEAARKQAFEEVAEIIKAIRQYHPKFNDAMSHLSGSLLGLSRTPAPAGKIEPVDPAASLSPDKLTVEFIYRKINEIIAHLNAREGR